MGDTPLTSQLRRIPTASGWREKLGLSSSADVAALLAALLTTRGDLIVRGNGSPPVARLPIGAAGTLLRSDGIDASWATLTAYLDAAFTGEANGDLIGRTGGSWTNRTLAAVLGDMLTTRGDIFRRGSSGVERLAALTANTFVGGDGTDVGVRTAAQVLTSLGIVVGTYTPTLSNTTNVAASTALSCMYAQVSTMVFVFGAGTVDPTAAAPTATVLGVSLPVASNFGGATQAAGLLADNGTESGIVESDSTNDRLSLRWQATDASNHNIRFIAMYQVI